MRILVIEDDLRLADVLRRSLSEHGHVVDLCFRGDEGEAAALAGPYEVIILDGLLPGKDGNAVARSLRASGNCTPILMLTARDTTADIVAGLDAGADDYVCKPFELAEVEARLRTIFRRRPGNSGKLLQYHDVMVDLAALEVRRGERAISLTAREFAFLEYFMRNPERVLTRAMIEDALWDERRDSGASNIIDVYVGRVRNKISVGTETQLLFTLRGQGYRFGPPAP